MDIAITNSLDSAPGSLSNPLATASGAYGEGVFVIGRLVQANQDMRIDDIWVADGCL